MAARIAAEMGKWSRLCWGEPKTEHTSKALVRSSSNARHAPAEGACPALPAPAQVIALYAVAGEEWNDDFCTRL